MQRPSIWEIERRRESPSRTCCILCKAAVQLQSGLPIETIDVRDWNEVGLLPGIYKFTYLIKCRIFAEEIVCF